MTTRHTTMPSPLGLLTLTGTDEGLTGILFERASASPGHPETAAGDRDVAAFSDARQQLEEFFEGRRTTFELRLARSAGTPFQREVWEALMAIPYGATCSYGELARRIGRPGASRAVGAANGCNCLPIVIPCHRVIGASGTLTGYAGGMERKRWLLDLEQGQRTFSNPAFAQCERR